MKKLIILSIASLLGAVPVSYGGLGTTGAQFLKIDPGARPVGMGGAYSAVVSDANTLFYNPAGIAQMENRQVSGTYLRYFQSINYGNIAGVMPSEGSSSWGMGITYLGVTDIPHRGLVDTDDPTGTGSPESTFGSMDTAFNLAYARQNPFPSVLDGLDLGAKLGVIYQTLEDKNSVTAMVDVGGFYSVNEKLSLALVFQNIGMGVKFDSKTDPLPFNIKAGVAFKPVDGLTLACDINEYILDEQLYASIGAEYWIMDMLALRGGYKYGYDTQALDSSMVGFSGGLGFSISNMNFDYAMAPFGDLGDTHRVTLSVNF